MKNKFLIALLTGTLVFSLTGCGDKNTNLINNNENNIDNGNETNNNNEDDGNHITAEEDNASKYFNITGMYRVGEFEDGYMRLGARGQGLPEGELMVNTKYEAISVVPPSQGYSTIGAYSITNVEDKDGYYHVIDARGAKVFSYKKNEYKEVHLTTHGYLIIKKQNDTYNSSETTYGVYSLKDKKYVVEPTSKYNNYYEWSKDMYMLDTNNKVFFNSNTGKVVTFNEEVHEKFQDGYAVDMDLGFIKVFKDDGTIKKFDYKYDDASYNAKDCVKNGYVVDAYNGVETHRFRVINLENGEIKDFSDKFYAVTNKPKFTKSGYALILLENQGGTLYYTVMDLKGNLKFEPVKISTSNQFLSNYDKELSVIGNEEIQSEKYILIGANGNNKTQVRDLNNKLILEGEENEEFVSMIGDVIVVSNPDGALANYYLKDLQGNKVKIKNKIQ